MRGIMKEKWYSTPSLKKSYSPAMFCIYQRIWIGSSRTRSYGSGPPVPWDIFMISFNTLTQWPTVRGCVDFQFTGIHYLATLRTWIASEWLYLHLAREQTAGSLISDRPVNSKIKSDTQLKGANPWARSKIWISVPLEFLHLQQFWSTFGKM